MKITDLPDEIMIKILDFEWARISRYCVWDEDDRANVDNFYEVVNVLLPDDA